MLTDRAKKHASSKQQARSAKFPFQGIYTPRLYIISLAFIAALLPLTLAIFDAHSARVNVSITADLISPQDLPTRSQIELQPTLKVQAQPRPEALVQSEPIASQNEEHSLPSTRVFDEDFGLDDHLCAVSRLPRNSTIRKDKSIIVPELALSCSQLSEHNYKNLFLRSHDGVKRAINQLKITQSEPKIVFAAIGLICDQFNCSELSLFNISGQDVLDCSMLASWLSSWPQLEVLDLSNTTLRSIESALYHDWRPPTILQNLTKLILDYNKITELNLNYIVERTPSLRHLSLINNSVFEIYGELSSQSKVQAQMKSINLAGNSIHCDNTKLWLMRHIANSSSSIEFPDADQVKCGAPERMVEMTWSQRVSVLETKICDICDCRSPKKTAISVDCHNRSLTALPDVLPLNTKVLNLTRNRITTFGVPHNFINWENVTYIHIADNLIETFQPVERKSKFLRNLAALDIRKNKFQEFPIHIFQQFVNLDQVHLSDNPWLCDCSTIDFQEWLQRQFHKVYDKEDIVCGISGTNENGVRSHSLEQRLSNRVIYRLANSELCPQENLEGPYDWLDIVNVLLGLAIIFVLTKVAIDYIYQHRTKRLPRFFKFNYYF